VAHAPIIIVDPDESRRRTLSLLTRAAMQIDVGSFPTLASAFPGFCEPSARVLPESTRLFICPWDEGGEAMALERIVLGGSGPSLLALQKTLSSFPALKRRLAAY